MNTQQQVTYYISLIMTFVGAVATVVSASTGVLPPWALTLSLAIAAGCTAALALINRPPAAS